MTPVLSPDEVRHLAALARLELTPEEHALFSRQLADVLAYAAQVREVDTTGVQPTTHVLSAHDAFRPDEPRPSLPREEALANAPDPAPGAGLFRVPRVIGG